MDRIHMGYIIICSRYNFCLKCIIYGVITALYDNKSGLFRSTTMSFSRVT